MPTSALLSFQERSLSWAQVRAFSEPCGPVCPVSIVGALHPLDFDVPGYFLVCVFRQEFVESLCLLHCCRFGLTALVAERCHHIPEHQVVLPFEALLCYDRAVVVPPSYH